MANEKIEGAVRKLRAVMDAFDMKGTNRATMLNAINTIETLNTRPAAPVEGLVRYDISMFGNGIVEMGGGQYVRFDQAEAIIAAERAMRKTAEQRLAQSQDDLKQVRADNAALTARVKELSEALEEISKGETTTYDEDVGTDVSTWLDEEEMQSIARAALEVIP